MANLCSEDYTIAEKEAAHIYTREYYRVVKLTRSIAIDIYGS